MTSQDEIWEVVDEWITKNRCECEAIQSMSGMKCGSDVRIVYHRVNANKYYYNETTIDNQLLRRLTKETIQNIVRDLVMGFRGME